MMQFIRWILGKLILTYDALFVPRGVSRPPQLQAELDRRTASLALYEYEACPFCVKVRRGAKRLGLKIERRDAKKNPAFADELLKSGGQLQVPCLKISEPQGVRWLYESSDILRYLEELAAVPKLHS